MKNILLQDISLLGRINKILIGRKKGKNTKMMLIKKLIEYLYEDTKNKKIEWKYTTDFSIFKNTKLVIEGNDIYYIYLNKETVVGLNRQIVEDKINLFIADDNISRTYHSYDIYTEFDENIHNLYHLIADDWDEPFQEAIFNYMQNRSED